MVQGWVRTARSSILLVLASCVMCVNSRQPYCNPLYPSALQQKPCGSTTKARTYAPVASSALVSIKARSYFSANDIASSLSTCTRVKTHTMLNTPMFRVKRVHRRQREKVKATYADERAESAVRRHLHAVPRCSGPLYALPNSRAPGVMSTTHLAHVPQVRFVANQHHHYLAVGVLPARLTHSSGNRQHASIWLNSTDRCKQLWARISSR